MAQQKPSIVSTCRKLEEDRYTKMASKAYREIASLGLNPRKFLPTVSFLATVAEIEALPEEDFLLQVRDNVYDILRERSAPDWSAYVRKHGGAK